MDHRYIFYMAVGYLAGSMLFALEYPKIFKGVDVRRLSEDGNPEPIMHLYMEGSAVGSLPC